MAEFRIDVEASAQKIISKIEERFGVPAERLLELAQADREGRCVVLPCKSGDTVFRVLDGGITEMVVRIFRGQSSGNWEVVAFTDRQYPIWTSYGIDFNSIGKSVFLTRETAEAALKEVGPQK